MNRRSIFVSACLVVLLSTGTQAQKAGWRIAYNVPNRNADDLLSVFFHTRHIGWAVGDGHTNYTGIYKTVDGGKNWQRLDLFDGQEHGPDFSAVRFSDARHGWIATRTSKFVLRTTDGGETWEPMDVSGDYLLANRILPVGANTLFIAADNSTVHRTLDGGNSWESVRLQPDNDKVLDIVRPAPDVLFALVSDRYGKKATFYRSTDGGGNWEMVSELAAPVGAIAFKDADNGVAMGKDAAWNTSDGGRTWKKTVAAGWRNAVAYVGDMIVGVGENPHVLISNNGGRTWVAGPTLPAPVPAQLHDLAVVDPGWWFAPSDRDARVYGFFDPENDHAFGESRIMVPRSLRGEKSGNRLPPGTYNALLRHVGYDHALVLTLVEPAPGNTIGVKKAQLADNEFACTECEAVIPVELEYGEKQSDADPAQKVMIPVGFSLKIEPSEDGVAIVAEANVLPSLSALPYLAAFGVTPATNVELKAETKKSGGLLDRARKAAQGDVKGAVAGLNPKAASERARAAQAIAPTFYTIKLRYNLPLTARKEGGQ